MEINTVLASLELRILLQPTEEGRMCSYHQTHTIAIPE